MNTQLLRWYSKTHHGHTGTSLEGASAMELEAAETSQTKPMGKVLSQVSNSAENTDP